MIHNNKIKKWNFIALILCGIEVVLSIFDLLGLIIQDKTLEQRLANVGTEIFAVLSLLISIAFFILFLKSNKKLKSNQEIRKYPYFSNLIWTVIVVLFTILNTNNLDSTTNDVSNILGALLFTIFVMFLLKIPILMVLINIFKLDIGENNA